MSPGLFFALWALGWVFTLREWVAYLDHTGAFSLDTMDGEEFVAYIFVPGLLGVISWPLAALFLIWKRLGLNETSFVHVLGRWTKAFFTLDKAKRKERLRK